MSEDILNELGRYLVQTISIYISKQTEQPTIGVAVVEDTKVMFMSCSMRSFVSPGLLTTRPSKIDLYSVSNGSSRMR